MCVCACLFTDMHVEGQPQETGMGTQQPSHGHCESLCPLVSGPPPFFSSLLCLKSQESVNSTSRPWCKKEMEERETRVSGCGAGEEGGAELGTAEGERHLEKDNIRIAAGTSRALCLCRILSLFQRLFTSLPFLCHLHNSGSICI